jgi:hypothetical protein
LLKSKIEEDIGGVHIRETFDVLYPGFLYDWYSAEHLYVEEKVRKFAFKGIKDVEKIYF